ncbi:restriction endonuclease subunit S [Flavobacterium columnare]|uniref:Restriction endonuclease subunit S n=1 Tax=Flavobacterium columnare TaxID=996 RepID=A0A437U8N2_9FLAO|nr:restriction endonuclease subunit S [Flavobacterium columnare]RVU90000.1 restriction endonuclease subunit S [Flavobacterium columnare]
MDEKIINRKYPTKRLKFVVTINDDTLTDETDPDFEINYIDIGNVDSTGKINEIINYKFSEAPSRARRKVKHKDVIISTVRTYLRAIASIDFEMENLIVSTGFAVIRPKRNVFDPNFCKYSLIESNFIDEVQKRSVGVSYPAINASDLGDIYLPIPSLEQQNKIVHYLDREIAKIDALIEKKTKLIALLEEKKKAVINQAVTKGLDTTVAMKDSGIEWLGEIPEHWEVNKISRVFDSIGSGTTPTSSNLEYYQDGNHSWLITSDLNDSYIFETSKKITDAAVYDFSALKLFPSNSLVIAMYGATIGKTGLTKIECYTNQACCVISNSTKVHIRYAHFYFIAMKQNLVNLSNGGGQPNISQGIIRDFKIVYPNLIEQEKIINFLENKIEETDLTIQKIIKTINLLKEKRTAIISAAINGEINLD